MLERRVRELTSGWNCTADSSNFLLSSVTHTPPAGSSLSELLVEKEGVRGLRDPTGRQCGIFTLSEH